MTDSRRITLCQCPGCGREKAMPAKMARIGDEWVIVLRWPNDGFTPVSELPLCPVCGLKPGEPETVDEEVVKVTRDALTGHSFTVQLPEEDDPSSQEYDAARWEQRVAEEEALAEPVPPEPGEPDG